jgi:membrane-associated protease RseP (regulator of RpoE activity)
MDTVAPRPAQRPLLHLGLLLLTVGTTFGTYLVVLREAGWDPAGEWSWQHVPWDWWRVSWDAVRESLQFSLSAIAILGCHEMGHWVAARHHRVETSLPYFLPVPLFGFGTLGAVIRIRGRIPSRNALVDIGAAGPLAGFLVAVPVLLWGYAHTHLVPAVPLPGGIPAPDSALGALLHLASSAAPAAPEGPQTTVFGDSLLTLLVQRFTIGVLPPGTDVAANGFIIAGWFGCLVTMLNLIPIGQLDAGHLAFANLGRRATGVGKLAAAGLLGLVLFFNWSWVFWLLVVALVVGFRHPEVERPEEPLDLRRVWICIACLAVFVLCVIPSPVQLIAAP